MAKKNSSEAVSQTVDNKNEKSVAQPWDTFGDFS
jgi:hypothetical protein